eukprot:984752-Amorphochlora_amoeboformis.AAC.1
MEEDKKEASKDAEDQKTTDDLATEDDAENLFKAIDEDGSGYHKCSQPKGKIEQSFTCGHCRLVHVLPVSTGRG